MYIIWINFVQMILYQSSSDLCINSKHKKKYKAMNLMNLNNFRIWDIFLNSIFTFLI